jgi:hypothetical protein
VSLHGRLAIGTRPILVWEAKRIRPADGPAPETVNDWPASASEPDAINIYQCWVTGPAGEPVWEGEISHRFGDGAAVLAATLLAKAAVPAARFTLAGHRGGKPSSAAHRPA